MNLLVLFFSVFSFADGSFPSDQSQSLRQLIESEKVQEQVSWVLKQNFHGATFANDFQWVHREQNSPQPGVRNFDHFLMFLSLDWRWMCQVYVSADWAESSDAEWKLMEHQLEEKPLCYPRI